MDLPEKQFHGSCEICSPLLKLIIDQGGDVLAALSEQVEIKLKLEKKRAASFQAEALLTTSTLPPSLQRRATAAQEKGTSAWLTAVPLERHGFALHKGEFRDSIALRYGWPVLRVPEKCVCNAPFSVDHAMICRKGGYPTLRHNEVRNLVASAFNEVCTDVSVEPRLQPLSGEALPPAHPPTRKMKLASMWKRGDSGTMMGKTPFLTSGCFTLLRLPISVPV